MVYRTRSLALLVPVVALLTAAQTASAHDSSIGNLVVEHPYAPPSLAGVKNGSAYLRRIRNTGDKPDRLVGASTQVAAAVELHRMEIQGQVMRMREIPAIELPAHQEVTIQRGSPYHLMLVNLKQPLKHGDSFDLLLKFERAGSHAVRVVVQAPRIAPNPSQHRH